MNEGFPYPKYPSKDQENQYNEYFLYNNMTDDEILSYIKISKENTQKNAEIFFTRLCEALRIRKIRFVETLLNAIGFPPRAKTPLEMDHTEKKTFKETESIKSSSQYGSCLKNTSSSRASFECESTAKSDSSSSKSSLKQINNESEDEIERENKFEIYQNTSEIYQVVRIEFEKKYSPISINLNVAEKSINLELRFQSVYDLINSKNDEIPKPKHIFFVVGNAPTEGYLFNCIGYNNPKLSNLESLTILVRVNESNIKRYTKVVLDILNINANKAGVLWRALPIIKVKYNGYEREVYNV
jgi:hypothetical protein